MDISILREGMRAITKIRAKMFMPMRYLEVVESLSGSVQYCHVSTLDMPTNKLQTFLRYMSNKVIKWHHQAVSEFQFIHKKIYGRRDIKKRYVNVAKILDIADVSTCLTINV